MPELKEHSAQKASSSMADAGGAKPALKKKGKGAGIFIAAVCLAIALAAAIPYFMSSSEEPADAAQVAQLDDSKKQSSQAPDIIIDEGELPEPIPEGIAVQTPKSAATQSIVIDGEELSEIEANFKKPAAVPAAAAGMEDAPSSNAGLQAQQKPNPEDMVQKRHSAAADSEAQVQAEALQDAPIKQTQKQENKPQSSSLSAVSPENVPFSGEAIPGGTLELQYKNPAHFTVQAVSGSSRANLAEVSAGLKGRYWIYETVHDGHPWYVLITGEYPSRKAAADAAAMLPAYVKGAKPFPKSFAAVLDEISIARKIDM